MPSAAIIVHNPLIPAEIAAILINNFDFLNLLIIFYKFILLSNLY